MEGIIDVGAVIGTSATADTLAAINGGYEGNSSIFEGVPQAIVDGAQHFHQVVTSVARTASDIARKAASAVMYTDGYKAITSDQDLQFVSPMMQEVILMHEPIRKLYEQDRIFGFGWEALPEEDVYGRLLANGHVPDLAEAADEDGNFEFKWTFRSTDPDVSIEELDMILATRKFLDRYLEETDLDPTDYGEQRG